MFWLLYLPCDMAPPVRMQQSLSLPWDECHIVLFPVLTTKQQYHFLDTGPSAECSFLDISIVVIIVSTAVILGTPAQILQ